MGILTEYSTVNMQFGHMIIKRIKCLPQEDKWSPILFNYFITRITESIDVIIRNDFIYPDD